MRLRIVILLCLWICGVYGYETDFDSVVVGTSPICMCEAIYKAKSGERVLVVERAAVCGGAWKSISICGIPHVDLGCHEFGGNRQVEQFLEDYLGCKMIRNAPQNQAKGVARADWGAYPQNGCFELARNLEALALRSGVALMLNSNLESVYIDKARKIAEIKINGSRYSTRKIVVTAFSEIHIENVPNPPAPRIHKFPHLYLLIKDPTPTRFTYHQPSISGVTRVMNVTQFSNLEGTGMQIISLQVRDEKALNQGEKCFEELKRLGLIDKSAQLACVESYVYEQSNFDRTLITKAGPEAAVIFEQLDTNHISNIGRYVEKWKKVLMPWKSLAP